MSSITSSNQSTISCVTDKLSQPSQYNVLWQLQEKNILVVAETWQEAVAKLPRKEPELVKRKWHLVNKQTEIASPACRIVRNEKEKDKVINKRKRDLVHTDIWHKKKVALSRHEWTGTEDYMLKTFRGIPPLNSWVSVAKKMNATFSINLSHFDCEKRFIDLLNLKNPKLAYSVNEKLKS